MNMYLIILAALAAAAAAGVGAYVMYYPSMEVDYTAMENGGMSSESWKDIALDDVKTGETFTISGFSGKSVLLETFAVWCPTCKRQQDEIQKLHEELGDSVVSVSVDVDPNEDESKVLEHLDRYGYDWRYAVADNEFTQDLINDFGINVVNAPSAPVIMVCENGDTRLLDFGVKTSDELKSDLETGC